VTCLGERLTALVDGELDHDERDRALAHLAGCAACRAEADTMRRLKSRLRGLASPPQERPERSGGAPDLPDDAFLRRLRALGEPAGPDGSAGPADSGGPAGRFGGVPGPESGPALRWEEPSGGRGNRFGGAGARASSPLRRASQGGMRAGAVRPRDNRPAVYGGAGVVGRRRIPRRYLAVGAAAMVFGLGSASYAVGGENEQQPSVVPAFDRLEVEHALTNGVIPLTETSPAPAVP
jgi:anti-sigma factor RsiW